MKKIINGKVYNTDTAREVGIWTNTWDHHSWTYEHESLYQKRTGEYFIYGEGGPQTKYAESTSDNQWSGGEKIIPLSPAKAREWAEKHLSADEYKAAFGLPDEDAEDVVLYVKVPAAIMAKLKTQAAERGASVTEIVNEMLRQHI